MQAVILAGGLGTRLRPLTLHIPKAMVPVGGAPIIERTLSLLPDAISEVVIVVGYKGDVIKGRFGDSFGGKKIRYVTQAEQRGTADALAQARPYLTRDLFLFLSGDDLYCGDDLQSLSREEGPTVLVSRSDKPEQFGVCLTDEKGFLVGMLEKQKNPPSNLVNTGAYLLNPGVFSVPPPVLPNGELNLAEQIGIWSEKQSISTVEAAFWHPINNHYELAEAEKRLAALAEAVR